jgi:hypothetical protein
VQHRGRGRFVTPTNILFHAVSIAKHLKIEFPVLNTSLIAYTFIKKLGLPYMVWLKYIKLAQLYKYNPEPIRGLERYIFIYV